MSISNSGNHSRSDSHSPIVNQLTQAAGRFISQLPHSPNLLVLDSEPSFSPGGLNAQGPFWVWETRCSLLRGCGKGPGYLVSSLGMTYARKAAGRPGRPLVSGNKFQLQSRSDQITGVATLIGDKVHPFIKLTNS